MARRSFVIPLPLQEFRERLRRSFEEREERIRERVPTDLRGELGEGEEFWIQWCDPRRPNQWNDTLRAAPRVPVRATADSEGATRITVTLRRSSWTLVVLLLGSAAAAGLLTLILRAIGVFGQRGYVFGMKTAIAYAGGALVCVLLGMMGALFWGRADPTPARMALLRAVGLFGVGRSRPPSAGPLS